MLFPLENYLEIGKECEIIKLTPDYMGIWDVITYYAEKLACMDDVLGAIVTNIPTEDIEKYALEFLPTLTNPEMQYLQLPLRVT